MRKHTILQEPVVALEPPKPLIMEPPPGMAPIPQYSLRKTLLVWAAAALPMGILGWVVAPALTHDPQNAAFVRVAMLTVGLVWQFLLVMGLLYQEAGNLRWSTIRQRLWLTRPRSPRSGTPRGRLWWWLLPLILVTAFFQLKLMGAVDHAEVSWVPFLADSHRYAATTFLATPEAKAQLVGAWGFLGLYVVNALFNTVLGEELLFRGLLLPRMAGVFGRWDWVMNAVLFGCYHLHQPYGIASSILLGLIFALPSRSFRSSWFGIIAHSGQSVYLSILILGLVLGVA